MCLARSHSLPPCRARCDAPPGRRQRWEALVRRVPCLVHQARALHVQRGGGAKHANGTAPPIAEGVLGPLPISAEQRCAGHAEPGTGAGGRADGTQSPARHSRPEGGDGPGPSNPGRRLPSHPRSRDVGGRDSAWAGAVRCRRRHHHHAPRSCPAIAAVLWRSCAVLLLRGVLRRRASQGLPPTR